MAELLAEKTHEGPPGLQDGRPLATKSRGKTEAGVRDPPALCRRVRGEGKPVSKARQKQERPKILAKNRKYPGGNF